MREMTFQAARPEDLPEIMALQVQVFTGEQQIPEPLVRSVQDAQPQWWCAKQEGKLLGTAAAWQEDDVTHWGRFAVQSDQRGRGIGKRLARYSLEQLFAQQVQRVYMEAREATVHIICQMGGVVVGEAVPFFVGTVTPVEITRENFFNKEQCSMKLIQKFITKNDCYQYNLQRLDERYSRFQDEGPKGLMLHSVGCGEPTADVWVESWDCPGKEIMVHAFVEIDRVVQTLPWNYRAWHAGGSGNNSYIGVEMTEPASIVYPDPMKAEWIDKDPVASEAHVRATYALAVELFAHLCREFSLEPLADGVIISHAEGHKRGVASGHADPEHIWDKFGLTMDGFRRDVAEMMKK